MKANKQYIAIYTQDKSHNILNIIYSSSKKQLYLSRSTLRCANVFRMNGTVNFIISNEDRSKCC